MSLQSNQKLLKNLLSLTVAEATAKGLTIFLVIYMARILGPDNYGIIGHAKAFVGYFTLFVLLGYDTYGMREISKDYSKIKENVDYIFSIKLYLSIISYSLLIILTFSINAFIPIQKVVILITGLNVFSLGLSLLFVYQGIERMQVIAIRTVLVSVINFIGILVFVKDETDTVLAVTILAVSLLINTIWIIIYYWKEYGKIKIVFDTKKFLQIFNIAFPIGLTFVIGTLYNNLDVFMLGFMRTKAETGVYSISLQLVMIAFIINGIVQNAFLPQETQAKTNEERKSIVNKAVLVMSLIIGLVVPSIIIFSDYFHIILGEGYEETSTLLHYFAIKIFLILILVNYFSPLIAWGYEKQVVVSNIAGLILNLLLNFILIPIWGIYGAAVATIAAELIVLIILARLFYKVTNDLLLTNHIKTIKVVLITYSIVILAIYLGIPKYIALILTLILYPISIFLTKVISFNELRKLIK